MNFSGEIEFHNDVIYTYFTVEEDMTDVRLWTDSYMSGVNFDPIAALWNADGTLIDQSDDNATINTNTQTSRDAGFNLNSLLAGEYIFSISTYNNFALGNDLNDGFLFQDQDPVALQDWRQPTNGWNKGSYWSLWLDGVSSASNNQAANPVSVPEPSSFILLLLGTLGLGMARRKSC